MKKRYQYFKNSFRDRNERIIQNFPTNKEVVKIETKTKTNQREVDVIRSLALNTAPGRDRLNTK